MADPITGAVLGLLGFGAAGPVAGTCFLPSSLKFKSISRVQGGLAAWFQGVFGVNVVFSALQSAAMAGYGATAVSATLIPGLAAVGGGVSVATVAIAKGLARVIVGRFGGAL